MKILGTNIDSYKRLYEIELLNKKDITPSDLSGADSTKRQKIEFLLTFGYIEPLKNGSYQNTKNNLLIQEYKNLKPTKKKITSCLIQKFEAFQNYNSDISGDDNSSKYFSYKSEDELIQALMYATIYYFGDKELLLKYMESNKDFKEDNLKYYHIDLLNDKELIKQANRAILDVRKNNDEIGKNKRKANLEMEIDSYIHAECYKYIDVLRLFMDSGNTFKIPVYQRDYVWEFDKISSLIESININDITNLSCIVLHEKKISPMKTLFTVVDGQQRLTSLFIILKALDTHIAEQMEITINSVQQNHEKAASKYISLHKAVTEEFFKDMYGKTKIIRNFTRVDGDDTYNAFIDIMSNTSTYATSATLISMNYKKTIKYLSENYNTPEKTEALLLKLLNNVNLILSFDSVTNEMKLFEILNTSSIKLTTLDLMKSYLMSLAKPSELEESEVVIQQKFHSQIISSLKVTGKKNLEKEIESFIRIYLRFSNKLSKEKTLFENFKDMNNILPESLRISEVNLLITEIAKILRYYKIATRHANKESIEGLEINDFTYTLDREIYAPIMMFFIQKYFESSMTSNNIRECLFEFEKFEIIFQVCNYRGQSLSDVMDRALLKIRHLETITPKKIRKIMEQEKIFSDSLNIGKNEFEKRMNDFKFSEQLSRKLLIRITNYLYNGNKIKLNNNDKLILVEEPSAEHLCPKQATKWFDEGSITPANHLLCHELLGNYLVIDKKMNASISNNIFKNKQAELKQYTHIKEDITITGFNGSPNILTIREWNEKTILKRTKELTKISSTIWVENK